MDTRRATLHGGLHRYLTNGLHLGRLHAGERLASARQTAREAGADYRTVVAAFRGLERDGLLEIRPRGGIYVGPRGARSGASARRSEERLVDVVLDELAAGLTPAAIRERLRRCLDTTRLRAVCIECNEDQLYFLRQELQARFDLASDAVEVAHLRHGVPVAVRRADLVVSTCFHAGEVRRCAARIGKPCIIATLDPQRRADVARRLAEGPVYLVGTDPRWADKARQIWAAEPGSERLHVLTLGRDSLADLPEGAAVLLMPRARHALAGTPLLARAMPPYGLSAETARDILSFVVRANLASARSC